MSAKLNHNNRSSRIKHFNKTNFNTMIRRKRIHDLNWSLPYIRIPTTTSNEETL